MCSERASHRNEHQRHWVFTRWLGWRLPGAGLRAGVQRRGDWPSDCSISAVPTNFQPPESWECSKKVCQLLNIQLDAAFSRHCWKLAIRKKFCSCVNLLSESFSAYSEHSNSGSFGGPLRFEKHSSLWVLKYLVEETRCRNKTFK